VRLFDTTLLVDFARKADAARRIVQEADEAGERCATTEVNAFELLLGGFSKGRAKPDKLDELQRFLHRLDVLPLDRAGALRAAELVSRLRGEGRDVGALDALIAGIALASGYDTIVTRDESFRQIPGVRVQTY